MGIKKRLKISILGDFATGKTQLVNVANQEPLDSYYKPGDFKVASWRTRIAESDECLVQIWSISDVTNRLYMVRCSGSGAALICWDLSRDETFNSIEQWFTTFKNDIGIRDDEYGRQIPDDLSFPIAFVATKSDIKFTLNLSETNSNAILSEDIKKCAETLLKLMRENNHQTEILIYITSAKNNEAYRVRVFTEKDIVNYECGKKLTIGEMLDDYTRYVDAHTPPPSVSVLSKTALPKGYGLFDVGYRRRELKSYRNELNQRNSTENAGHWVSSCFFGYSTGQLKETVNAILSGQPARADIVNSSPLRDMRLLRVDEDPRLKSPTVR